MQHGGQQPPDVGLVPVAGVLQFVGLSAADHADSVGRFGCNVSRRLALYGI
jgi:hypothetical protein